MSEIPTSPDADVRRQLLLAFPDLDLQHRPVAVVASLVEGAAFSLFSESQYSYLVTATDVIKAIKDLTGLEYEKVEIISAFEHLATRSSVSFAHERRDSVVFTDNRIRDLRQILRERLDLERLVQDQWFAELRSRHTLSIDQLQQLWSSLQTFINAIINANAAEAAAYLYLSTDMDQVRFYDILNSRLPAIDDVVPSDVLSVAAVEFETFFRRGGQQRTDYLALRLRGAFFYHLLTIDPRASELVRDSVAGKTLFLDTNILYRALGLQGPAFMFVPATTLEIAKILGCKLVVTGETVNEFLRTLRAEAEHVRGIPVTRQTYQQLVADHPSDEWAFMFAYYRELSSGRVKDLDEFERKYSNIEKFLSQWNIEIDEDLVLKEEERTNPEFRNQLSELNQWHNQTKGLTTLEHDVFLVRLVRKLRGATDKNAGSIRTWLLTHDRKLTRFAVHYAKAGVLPACMLIDSWLQIARPFLPRTDNYEKSLANVLQHPLLYHSVEAVPLDHMVNALHRLERYEEVPTPVLASMLADAEFVRRFNEAPTPEEERETLELKLAAVAKAAEEHKAQVESELERARAQIQVLETTVGLERRDKELAETKSQSIEVNAMQGTQALLRAHTEEIRGLRREFEEQIGALRASTGRRIAWVVYAFALIILSLTVSVTLITRGSQTSVGERIALLGWFVLAALLLLAIPMRRRFGTIANIVSIIGTLLTMIGLTYQLIELRGTTATRPPVVVPPGSTGAHSDQTVDSAKPQKPTIDVKRSGNRNSTAR